MNTPQSLSLTTPSGDVIVATLFEPDQQVHGQLVIGGAMGVPQRFYRHVASFFAQNGLRCLTFDYRGLGAPEVALQFRDIRVTDWAKEDLTTTIHTLNQHAPDLPLYYLGHSLGGQILGLSEESPKLTRILMVASGVGYWRAFPPSQWPKMWLAWFFLVPLLLKIKHFLPGWVLGGTNVPAAAVQQWRHWCLHPDYLWGDPTTQPHFYEKTADALFVTIADDLNLAPETAVKALAKRYPKAHHIIRTPQEVGMNRIGHFGAFRPETGQPLWQEWLSWLTEGQLPTTNSGP